MRTFRTILLTALLFGLFLHSSFSTYADPTQLTLSELEGRLSTIDTELEELASYSLRSGVGAVGYLSESYKEADNKEWIRINFDQEYPIDQVILVPCIWRDPKTGLRADGFPLDFRITAGTSTSTNTIASFNEDDHLLPRIAPLVVSCASPIHAEWIEVEATKLTRWSWDKRYSLQFSEIMVFSGPDNIAIQQPVSVPNPNIKNSEGRRPQFLTDGFVPYLLDAAHGDSSQARIIQTRNNEQPALTIDLGDSYPVNQVNLHSVDLSHNIPEAAPNGYAMPHRLRVTAANKADFSDETELFEYRQKSVYDAGPIIIRRFSQTTSRYIRITALEPQAHIAFQKGRSSIGFAEIEVLSDGKNVAYKKSGYSERFPQNALDRMTDGHNFFGKILPIRDWMVQLARRHALETERPLIAEELNQRYALQKSNLRKLSWIATLLAIGIALSVFAVLILRMLQMRAVARIRERFAADLHDELGANIHGIGLLGDLALHSMDSPEELKNLLERTRELTERSGTAIRHCINLQEASGLSANLPEDMKKTAHRILADLEYTISIEGDDILQRLKPQIRTDLFLFFKECLVNISRHSEATQFSTELIADSKEIRLTIIDNGHGLPEGIPPSLKRRAHLLGAKVSTEANTNSETRITLQLRLKGKLLPSRTFA